MIACMVCGTCANLHGEAAQRWKSDHREWCPGRRIKLSEVTQEMMDDPEAMPTNVELDE